MQLNLCYLLSLLITLSNCQGGGGHSGGGGGGGGGIGRSRSNGGSGGASGVAGIIIGSAIGGLVLVVGSIYLYKNRYAISCTSFYLSKQLKLRFLSSFTHSNSTDHLEIVREINNDSWDGNFKQKGNISAMAIESFKIQESFENGKELHFSISGGDQFGTWNSSQGVWLQDTQSIYHMFFIKNYVDVQRAGQTGRWKYLVYTGQQDSSGKNFIGEWHYAGFEDDKDYSGNWLLRKKNYGQPVDNEELLI